MSLRAATLSGRAVARSGIRSFATVTSIPGVTEGRNHKVVLVGGGSAGMTISHQLLRTGRFKPDDIAIVDPSEWHHYQPGWTLVGGGLKKKTDLRANLASLIDSKIRHIQGAVQSFTPEENTITLQDGSRIGYEHLVVCPGIKVDFKSIKGLHEAVHDPQSRVSSIYSYDTCDKVRDNLATFKKGNAIFTHPAGVVKCAGAPQKIMWLASDGWRRAGLYNADPSKSDIQITFATAMPVMFGVPKYSEKLEALRKERGVEGLFQHDLVAVNGNVATLAQPDGTLVERKFDLLHAAPKMGAHDFIKNSPLADKAGFVDVDQGTLQHVKYNNVWSSGDGSSLATSKTAAAITAQAPVLVSNLLSTMDNQPLSASYNGYTSCPLLTEYGKVMLAEFIYGAKPHETFSALVDQGTPRKAFYHLKKDFFPWVYYKSMVKGTWGGPKGWRR